MRSLTEEAPRLMAAPVAICHAMATPQRHAAAQTDLMSTISTMQSQRFPPAQPLLPLQRHPPVLQRPVLPSPDGPH